jgi:Phytanoyl-CoA dioxygenase (PhyH)
MADQLESTDTSMSDQLESTASPGASIEKEEAGTSNGIKVDSAKKQKRPAKRNRQGRGRKKNPCQFVNAAGRSTCTKEKRPGTHFCASHSSQAVTREVPKAKPRFAVDPMERGALGMLDAEEHKALLTELLECAEHLWKKVKPCYVFRSQGKNKRTRSRVELDPWYQKNKKRAEKRKKSPNLDGQLQNLSSLMKLVSKIIIERSGDSYKHLTIPENPMFVVAQMEKDNNLPNKVKKVHIHRDQIGDLVSPQFVTVELLLNDIDYWNGSVQFWPTSTQTPLDDARKHVDRYLEKQDAMYLHQLRSGCMCGANEQDPKEGVVEKGGLIYWDARIVHQSLAYVPAESTLSRELSVKLLWTISGCAEEDSRVHHYLEGR